MTEHCAIKFVENLPLADGATPVDFCFDTLVPEFVEMFNTSIEKIARGYYRGEAVRFLDALQKHAPAGFVDALFGELAYRKASIFRVANDPQ